MTRDANALNALTAEMSRVDADSNYYALTLIVASEGQLQTARQTEFAGPGSKPMWEMRRASLVDPQNMRSLSRDMREGSVVVNSEATLAVFLRIGGNAILKESIFARWFAHLVEPKECVPSRAGEGDRSRESVEGPLVKHAPSRKMRMDVLRRDNFRCRICNRSPDDYVDIELHVRPWGEGGLTEANSLLTLCDSCHTGLDPHFEIMLLGKIPDGIVQPSVLDDVGDEFQGGVQRYRDLVTDLTKARHANG